SMPTETSMQARYDLKRALSQALDQRSRLRARRRPHSTKSRHSQFVLIRANNAFIAVARAIRLSRSFSFAFARSRQREPAGASREKPRPKRFVYRRLQPVMSAN